MFDWPFGNTKICGFGPNSLDQSRLPEMCSEFALQKAGDLQKSPKCILRGLFNFAEVLLSAVVGVSIECRASSVTPSEHDFPQELLALTNPIATPQRVDGESAAQP